MAPTVAILTHIPSPYQVELFDALAADGRLRPSVVYVYRSHQARHWDSPVPAHEHVVLNDGPTVRSLAEERVMTADFAVFNWYDDPLVRTLIRRRAASERPWCLWGERPGAAGWGFLGRLARRFLLRPLRRNQAPIWGIGSWAVDAWRKEFGPSHQYQNIPYFSDLNRFIPGPNRSRQPSVRRILYSGSLIRRKGVDLLAEAFARVAADRPNLRLDFVGAGDLETEVRSRLAAFQERVRFFGFRQWADLPGHYHSADVLCAPSRYDGWGLIVPEGLASGLPVVATDQMGAAIDLVRPGVNGWLVRASSLQGLDHAFRQVADMSDAELDAMSRAAGKTAAGHTLADGVRRFHEAVASALADEPANNAPINLPRS